MTDQTNQMDNVATVCYEKLKDSTYVIFRYFIFWSRHMLNNGKIIKLYVLTHG
jgi:hypothetical protein